MTDISWIDKSVVSPAGETLALSVSGDITRSQSAVIMCPGFTSRRLNATNRVVASRIVPDGVTAVLLDPSGHGDSEGAIEDQTILKGAGEIASVAAWIHGNAPNLRELGVLGNSFSAAAALLFAAQSSGLACLALKAPVPDYEKMRRVALGDEQMAAWEREGRTELPDGTPSNWSFIQAARAVNTGAALRVVSCPVLIVQGGADEQIPADTREELRAVAQDVGVEYDLVDGADHEMSDPYFQPVAARLSRFLLSNLQPGGPGR